MCIYMFTNVNIISVLFFSFAQIITILMSSKSLPQTGVFVGILPPSVKCNV